MLMLLVGFLIDLIKNSISAISYMYIIGSIIKIYQSGFIVINVIIENIFSGTTLNSLYHLRGMAVTQVNNMSI